MNSAAQDDLARLRAALDYPQDPAVPDVSAIIAGGRRAHARRRLLGTTAAAMVSAAVVVAAVAVVPAGRGSGPSAADPDAGVLAALSGGPAPAVLVADGAPVDEAPDRFDPMTRTLDVGWVPDGLNGGSVTVGTYEQSYGAVDDEYVSGGPDLGLSITVLSRGRGVEELPALASGLPLWAEPRPTEPVDGGAAECLSDPNVRGGTCTALRWEYAPGAWALVAYAGSAGPTPEAAAAVARRVAESVSLSAAEPVRLPFTLSGRSAGMQTLSTSVAVSDGVDPFDGSRWTVVVTLAPSTADGVPVRVLSSWTPGGITPGSDKYGGPNTTVDGHPAVLEGEWLAVWDVRGTTVWVLDAPDPVAVFGDLTVVEDPEDPAGWAEP